MVFGAAGVAGIGHSDSTQGTAPIFGGGAALQLFPRLVVEGDVHGARVGRVFGQDNHNFSEVTLTGSLLFRGNANGRTHLIAGGGIAAQRAHSAFDVLPAIHVDRTETIWMQHGRVGVEWDLTSRMVIRPEAVFWFGPGLDWVMGGRVGVGYRF